MTQMIAIDPNALDVLLSEVKRLHARLDAVQMAPRAEWVTVDEMATMIGKRKRTAIRHIERGQIEARAVGGTRMVRVNQEA